MKLYTLDHSPYSARVRAQIRHKSIPIELNSPRELGSEFAENTLSLGQVTVEFLTLVRNELQKLTNLIANQVDWWHHTLHRSPALLRSLEEMLLATVYWSPVRSREVAYQNDDLMACLLGQGAAT